MRVVECVIGVAGGNYLNNPALAGLSLTSSLVVSALVEGRIEAWAWSLKTEGLLPETKSNFLHSYYNCHGWIFGGTLAISIDALL